jgi:AraC-like DNA-binding protein
MAHGKFQGEIRPTTPSGRIIDDPTFPYQRSRPQAPDLPIPKIAAWSSEAAHTMLELLRQLGARLERWLSTVGIDSNAAAMDRRSRILHFIALHAHQGITLASLAKGLSLSTNRTSHVVREEFGLTYLTLVKQYRLERAASLLTHSNMAISDIALSSGFGDVSNFHRKFREHFKVTPRQFRLGEAGEPQSVGLAERD